MSSSPDGAPVPEIVIVRRRGGGEDDGHHGGVWKIAFADFMTAMMAFFLVLWLVSSTNKEQKALVARYFNPMQLSDVAPRRGLQDPKEGGQGGSSQEFQPDQKKAGDDKKGTADKLDGPFPQSKKGLSRPEATLFRDPYAVLAEIAGAGPGPGGPAAPPDTAARSGPEGSAPIEAFRDPFSPAVRRGTVSAPEAAARVVPVPAEALPTPAPAPTPPKPAALARPAPEAAKPAPATESVKTAAATEAARVAEAQAADAADAPKLDAELAKVVRDLAGNRQAPGVEVKATGEGVLISLTDEASFGMFTIGSAEPDQKVVRIMEKLAQMLKTRPGMVIIRGHTDARPFKSANYDNWRLSSSRAHMAQYMLIRGGLDEKRIERVEGWADRKPKVPDNPEAAENRRIEILLRRDKP